MGKKTTITLITFFIILIITIWGFTSIYTSANNQYVEGHEKSKELALEKGNLSSIDQIETFYGQITYHVMSGQNKRKEKVYVWVPQTKKNQDVIIKKQSSGITIDQALSEVEKEYDPVKIIDVKLGMDEEIPIWEVTYKDQSDRHTIDYVNFDNGDIIKHMAIKEE